MTTAFHANITNAAIPTTTAKVTPDQLLETIRENATIIMDQNLIKNHANAHKKIVAAINDLKKDHSELSEKIQRCISIISSKEQTATQKQAAYKELMGIAATSFSILTQNQINLVENQTAQFAQNKQQSEDELAKIENDLASGKITAQVAAERAAAINAELAQEEQELLQNSSYLSRLGAALASPFQWIGNKLFDEQTSNLKRAAYVAGAAAGAVALGAAAYYGMSYMSKQTPTTEALPQVETPQQPEGLMKAIQNKIQETVEFGKEKASQISSSIFGNTQPETPNGTTYTPTLPDKEALENARKNLVGDFTLNKRVENAMADREEHHTQRSLNPVTEEYLNEKMQQQKDLLLKQPENDAALAEQIENQRLMREKHYVEQANKNQIPEEELDKMIQQQEDLYLKQPENAAKQTGSSEMPAPAEPSSWWPSLPSWYK